MNSRIIYMELCNCFVRKMLLAILVVLCWTLTIAQNGCQKGYRVAGVDNATCTDINECHEGGHRQCGQLCTNTPGSYHCSCLPGYELEADKWSCAAQAPDPYILFSHGLDISKMDPGGLNLNPVLQNVGDVEAFDYHYGTRSLFWIDSRQKAIGWAPLQGGDTGILISNLKRPKHLAIDWISHFIYWTDYKTRLIERVDLGGSNRDIIVDIDHGRPHAIAVDPFDGYIFWSISGKREKLERANLDGSQVETVASARLGDIVSITLDIVDKRLFWLDDGYSRIESADYDGNKRVVVREQLRDKLYGLSLFTDHVYWTELTKDTLSQANKYTGEDMTMLRTTYLDTHPKSIKVVHPLRQPSTPPTASVNCSTDGDCPLVITMSEPAEAKPFLVITNQHDIQRINFDGTDYVLVAIGNMENLVAMDYDIGDEMVYFADQGRGIIGRVSLDGTTREIVVGSEDIDVVEGIAIDWIRRRLYWTDSGRGTISTCQVDGGSIHIIAERNLQHPKAIAVHPTLNLVYWSDTAEPAKIEAARHDGTHRVTVALNVSNPNSITIDYLNNHLIWLDSSRLTIETANLDGTYRSILTDHNLGSPRAVAEFGNHLWFTNWEENLLVQVDKNSGEKKVRLRGSFDKPSGIQVVHPKSKQIGKINPCLVFNGGCEQICLVAHINQVICSCDAGYNLRQDGVSCDMDECWTREAQCHPHAICLDKDHGYECTCGPGYVGDGYNHCFAPTTPKSQLIAAIPVTSEPVYPTSLSDRLQSTLLSATATGFEQESTMSKKIVNRGFGAHTPRRSTTIAPRISTTRPPKGRRPNKGSGGTNTSNGRGVGANTSNNGGLPNVGAPNVPNNEKINVNGSNGGTVGKNGTNGGSGGKNGTNGGNGGKYGNTASKGSNGQTNGSTNQNGNSGFDTSGLSGIAGGPINDPGVTDKSGIPKDSAHFGICPNEYKYYCLNGGKCTWLKQLEKPSCRCLNNFGGERCLWIEPSYKSGISSVTVAAISGGILLPIIIFVLIVAFILYRKKRNSKAEKIRKASRPEIVLQPITNFSPSSQNNSASGSSFCNSNSLSLSSGSRRSSICTALISPPLDAEAETEEIKTPPVEHATASQTRSDPTSPGSPSMMKAVLSRLSDPGGTSPDEAKIKLTGNHYQVPKRSNPMILPKPQFKLAGGVAALARRQSQSESQVDQDDEHMYSVANHYVDMKEQRRAKLSPSSSVSSSVSTFLSGTMPRRTQTPKYMAMDYNYPTASLGRRKLDSVLYVNTPKKSSSASQVFSSHVQL